MTYILTAVFMILFGREKGPEPLGVFSIAFIIATIFRTINESGFDFSLPRDISIGKDDGIADAQQFKNLIWFLIFIPSAIVMYYTTGTVAGLILIIHNYFYTQTSTLKSVLKGRKKMSRIPAIEGMWVCLLMLINILTLYLFYNLALLFLFYLIIEIFKWIHYIIVLKKIETPGTINVIGLLKISMPGRLKENIKSQYGLVAMNFLGTTQYRVPLLALGWFSTQAAVGIYSGAFRFISIFKILPGSLLDALLPEFASDNRFDKLIKSLIYSIMLSFGIFLPVFIFAEEIIILLLTDKFADSVVILKILSFTFIPITINLILESYLISQKKEKVINITLFVSAMIILLFSYFSIRHFDIQFVALSAIFGEVVSLTIYSIVVLKISRKSFG